MQRTAAGRPVASAVAEREEAGAALVEDHRHLDRRARARARGRAGSSASRGRSPPGARRSAPAPRPSPRRARCCGWSGSIVKCAGGASHHGRSVEAPRRKRVFVDLDAEPGAVVDAAADRRRARRPWPIVLGEQPLGREAVRDARVAARRPQGLRRVGGGGDPDRAVESAGEVGRAAPRAISRAAPMPPTLASFTVATSQAPSSRARRGVEAARRRSRRRRSAPSTAPPQLGHLLEGADRLLGELDLDGGSSARSAPAASSTLQAPLASTRIATSGPSVCAPSPPASRRRPGPTLSLKVPNPRACQSSAIAGSAAGFAGRQGRVADAPASAVVGAEQPPDRAAARPCPRDRGSRCRPRPAAGRRRAAVAATRDRRPDPGRRSTPAVEQRAAQQRSRISAAIALDAQRRRAARAAPPRRGRRAPSPRDPRRGAVSRSSSSPRAVTYGSRNGSAYGMTSISSRSIGRSNPAVRKRSAARARPAG